MQACLICGANTPTSDDFERNNDDDFARLQVFNGNEHRFVVICGGCCGAPEPVLLGVNLTGPVSTTGFKIKIPGQIPSHTNIAWTLEDILRRMIQGARVPELTDAHIAKLLEAFGIAPSPTQPHTLRWLA